MANLKFDNINKIYEKDIQAVSDFNLEISDKEFIVFVGPSGCGKSTTLRMIAGLEEISNGSLYIDEKKMNNVAPKDRDIAMVFQSYALYPHMTVYDNLAFGLKLRKFKRDEIKQRVSNAANILGIEYYLDRKPKALSGGQRQRVALGREIVRDPKVLLMDEPLSNLDAKLRVQMRTEIQKLHQRLQTTTVYVTHDQTEAMTMATRIVVMKDGVIQQIGSPKEIYNFPINAFVGSFIGAPSMNFLEGDLTEESFKIGDLEILIPEGKMKQLKKLGYVNNTLKLGIRPENIHDEPLFINASENTNFTTTVDVAEIMGAEIFLYFRLNNQNLLSRVDSRSNVQPGDNIELAFDMNKAHFFDAKTDLRIQL